MTNPGTSTKAETAREVIRHRFISLSAAMTDLAPAAFGVRPHNEIQSDVSLPARYENRLVSAFLLLSHLRDDVRRLAKRIGVNPSVVNQFVNQSLAVRLCVRAGDTRKHGLGGRSRNATISNGLICVVKSTPGEPPSPTNDAIVVGMVLVDADHGVFHSHRVIARAIHDWVDFLASELSLDLRQEMDAWLPRKEPDFIIEQDESNPTVPLGSTIQFEFPTELTEQLVDDVKSKVDRT